MKKSILLLAALSPCLLFAQDHSEHQHMTTSEPENSMPVMRTQDVDLHMAQEAMRISHGDSITGLLLFDRFEYAKDSSTELWQWEGQGWIGRDFHKLWFKTEGEYNTRVDEFEEQEVQLLYSRAISPYWDIQMGLRHDEGSAASTEYAVLSLMGLAPYWFEIDVSTFYSKHGDLSARVELEYDLRFTQRLILQPRLELNYAFSNDAASETWKGANDTSLGLRLRYEVTREFAPYIGIQWWHAFGRAEDELSRSFKVSNETRLVAGLRVWY